MYWSNEGLTLSIIERFKENNKGIPPEKAIISCDNAIVIAMSEVTNWFIIGNIDDVVNNFCAYVFQVNGFVHYHGLLLHYYGDKDGRVQKRNVKLMKHIATIDHLTSMIPPNLVSDLMRNYSKAKHAWLDGILTRDLQDIKQRHIAIRSI